MPQEQAPTRMGVSRRRIPQIESGDAPSGDFELFVAEVRDELEDAA